MGILTSKQAISNYLFSQIECRLNKLVLLENSDKPQYEDLFFLKQEIISIYNELVELSKNNSTDLIIKRNLKRIKNLLGVENVIG